MVVRKRNTLPLLLAGWVCLGLPPSLKAVSPAAVSLSGGIEGLVTDASGAPQMGATVLLYNRQERLEQRALTNDRGSFAFASLAPDLYSIRVTLASFLPAVKSNILVQPGARSLLNVNLTNLFSSIQVMYPVAGRGAVMSEDWKWVLRSAQATRPVLRLVQDRTPSRRASAVFSDTRGLVRLSGGDGGNISSFGSEADLGTAFAFATSVFGVNQIQFSGNLAYGAESGQPAAGFRTSFSRDLGLGSPEIAITMRQLFVPARVGYVAGSGLASGSLPSLRTMSLGFEDQAAISDTLSFLYGFSLDSVAYLDRLNYFSPFARLTQDMGAAGAIDLTYTSGSARPDLGMEPAPGPDAELQRDINALSLYPRLSLRDSRVRMQRGENFEIGYSIQRGSRTLRVGAYRERVSNASLTMVAPEGLYPSGEMLPDPFSNSSIFNVGNYRGTGYSASLTQQLSEHVQAGVIYGSVAALIADDGALVSQNPDELRSMIRAGRRHTLTARAAATAPATGTHMVFSYQWSDHRSATRGHVYSTQSLRPEAGLNLFLRQPVPNFSGLPWRMEASADLRNLLAEGYLPLTLTGGRRLLLVHTPRSFRGGLSFIF
jgi:Carboxypeptidase regulatory-like domain